MSYKLIDSVEALKETKVITLLRGERVLAVDCEGVNLGRIGELCLMQIATEKSVYLLDIVKLGKEIFDLGEFCSISTFAANFTSFSCLMS
mgnify:CR=1 FL=1